MSGSKRAPLPAATSTLAIILSMSHGAFAEDRPDPAARDHAPTETQFITNARQIVFEGLRAGEGYFNPDGSLMVFQSEREPGNPFFQIYIMDMATGDTKRVSPGQGRCTCAWLHPDGRRVMFSSTHLDPDARAKQATEYEERASGKTRRYAFIHDPFFDVFESDLEGSYYKNLTPVYGYDAEGSYSPDGKLIAFTSNRHAYNVELTEADQQRLKHTPEYFHDIYIMNADGSDVRRLNDKLGYDGGPFFSPDGKRICWRRFNEEETLADVWTMNIDGTDEKRLTNLNAMSWAPFYHPSGDYLIFTTNLHGFKNFELYIVDVEGKREPVRVTTTDGADVLPVFTPEGRRVAWTSTRTAGGEAQIFLADWNDVHARKALGLAATGEAPTSAAGHPSPSRELPQTVSDITADDIQKHITKLSASRAAAAADTTRGTEVTPSVTDYVAAMFAKLQLTPSGDQATMFEFCEHPWLTGSKQEVAGQADQCKVLARLSAANASSDKPLVIGARVGAANKEGDGIAGNDVSGIAGLLEIAEYLAHEQKAGKLQLRRDIVFAAFSGDPLTAEFVTGGLGAILTTDVPSTPPVAAYLGLEDIGALTHQAVISGVGSSPVWAREIERRNVPVGLALATRPTPDLTATCLHFYNAAIPGISATTSGESAHTGDKLSAEGAAKIARLFALIAQSIAGTEDEPPFTPITERVGAAVGRPYLGTEPDYRGGIEGVKLTAVVDGGPAAVAGLRAGDIIVEFDGKPIKDVFAYAAALDGLKVGQTVTVVVTRDGNRVPVTIKVGQRD